MTDLKREKIWTIIICAVGGMVILGILAVVTVVGVGVWLWKSEPSYWTAQVAWRQSMTPAQLKQRSVEVTQRLDGWMAMLNGPPSATTQGSGGATSQGETAGAAEGQGGQANAQLPPGVTIDEDGSCRVTMSWEDANAWISEEGPELLREAGISGAESAANSVSDPMITTEGGRVVLAAQVQAHDVSQVVSAVLDVRAQHDGRIWVQLQTIRGGKLSVPGGVAKDPMEVAASKMSAEQKAQLDEVVKGKSFEAGPILARLGAKRPIQLTDAKFGPEGIELAAKPQ
ncbi:MAG: hypothetical protein IT443_13590 [Phycisphaeraceae bacterium]|nr:hypothetical protein [Phycisphaeraceae bacterium]